MRLSTISYLSHLPPLIQSGQDKISLLQHCAVSVIQGQHWQKLLAERWYVFYGWHCVDGIAAEGCLLSATKEASLAPSIAQHEAQECHSTADGTTAAFTAKFIWHCRCI